MKYAWILFTTLMAQACAAQTTENDQMVLALLYLQKSAEYRSLCYQAYNIAKMRCEEDLKRKSEKPRAVVLDIDETVLDNSPWGVRRVLEGGAFPAGWDEWMKEANAIAVPGALDFLNWADSSGFAIYYISNRSDKYQSSTVENLQKYKFPQVSDETVLLKKDKGKKERREKVLKDHRIVALVGDNLADFEEAYEQKSVEERYSLTDKFRDEFGSRFIVLPNPTYGDWEYALFNYNRKLLIEEKNKIRRSNLRRD